MNELEARTMRKVTRRLVPLLLVAYLACYLDKVNVGFAALTMRHDLAISATAYGFGAGIFFIAYSVLEVPSNLALARVGARVWLPRIMLTWGVVSGATAFVIGEHSFYVVRVLLGAAEAGFFPGVIYLLTLWFPARYRARVIGYFMVALPLSSLIGAPLSGLLLGLDGTLGLAGWQWIFLIQAVPSIALGVVVFAVLPSRPTSTERTGWLRADERQWLVSTLQAERSEDTRAGRGGTWRQILHWRVFAMAFVYFGAVATHQGMSFWLPQIVKELGRSNVQTGFLTAIPYAIGIVGMVIWGLRSDRHGERIRHACVALAIATAGIAVSAFAGGDVAKMIALSIAGFGIFAVLPVFWTLPTQLLGSRAAAGGIALVNAIGGLSGFVAPFVIGAIKDQTGGYAGGLLSLAGAAAVGLALLLVLGITSQTRVPPDPPLSTP